MAFLYNDVKLGQAFLYGDVSFTVPVVVVTPPPIEATNPPQYTHVDLVPVPANTTAVPADNGPTWVVLCSVCGKRVRADTARKRWDGVIVCQEDWEPRHPIEFIRARKPRYVPQPVPREPEPQFVALTCPYPQQLALADIGTADCAAAGSAQSIDQSSKGHSLDELILYRDSNGI